MLLPVAPRRPLRSLAGAARLAPGGVALFALILALSPTPARAQVIAQAAVVRTFKDGFVGGNPSARLLQASDGFFYGVTQGSGKSDDYGAVFRFAPSTKPVVLCRFNGPNGARPAGGLIQGSDGAFYGTTSAGGAAFNSAADPGQGTVFRLTTEGTLTTLHSFTGDDGAGPTGALVQTPDGTLYGTTSAGGPGHGGTVFKVKPTGAAFASLHGFEGTTNPLTLQGGLALGADGNLYGTTAATTLKPTPVGQLFRLGPDGMFTVVHEFQPKEGGLPSALTRGADGNLYGVLRGVSWDQSIPYDPVANAGTNYGGVVYRVLPDGGITPVYDIYWEERAVSGLTAAPDGTLYGCVVNVDGGSYPQLYHFKPDDTEQNNERDYPTGLTTVQRDDALSGELTVAADGNIYAVFPAGGQYKKHAGGILRVPGPTALPTVYINTHFIRLPIQTGNFVLNLDRPSKTDLVVKYRISGSASPGVDYLPQLSGRVKIKAGTTRQFISVLGQGNLGGQYQKIISLKMLPGPGYNLGHFGKTDLWIDDSANLPPGGGGGGVIVING